MPKKFDLKAKMGVGEEKSYPTNYTEGIYSDDFEQLKEFEPDDFILDRSFSSSSIKYLSQLNSDGFEKVSDNYFSKKSSKINEITDNAVKSDGEKHLNKNDELTAYPSLKNDIKEKEIIFNFVKKGRPKKNKQTYPSLKNDIKEKEIIFNFVKKGRPKKNKQNRQIKFHNKNTNDNARRKIFNSCKMSIFNFITEFTNIKLHVPTIEKQLGYSYKNIYLFLQKSIYQIFCDSSPKRVKDEIKNSKENYNYNKNQIDQLLIDEQNNENITIKIFDGLFKLTFGDFLVAYLNDEREIKICEINIPLKGFQTFGESFNERKNLYTQSQKNIYKKHIFDIIKNEKKYRKPRAVNR